MLRKYKLVWIILHATIVCVLLVALATGFRIATVNHPEMIHFSFLLPQGEIIAVHMYAAYGLMATLFGVILYVLRQKKYQSKRVTSRSVKYTSYVGFVIILLSMLSGWVIYMDYGLAWNTLDFHYYMAWCLLLYIIWHSSSAFVSSGIRVFTLIIFPIDRLRKKDSIVFVSMVMVFFIFYVLIETKTYKTLQVKSMKDTVKISVDGNANERIWQDAPLLEVKTYGGANFDDGKTLVSIQAVKNSQSIFFHFQWKDSSKSLKHLPLMKTKVGWKVLEDGFYHYDEQTYYEDKFAVMFSNSCEDKASKSIHLGPKPLTDKPANWHHKGYHYLTDNTIRDLWHWKAVRTDTMQQMDDNFISKPDIVREGNRRYLGGILADAKESGAYIMNWQWYTPQGIRPIKIAKNEKSLIPYQNNTHPLKWGVAWYDYRFYSEHIDTYPIGTLMPSVLQSSNQFEGDRGNIMAKGEWHDGIWSLEVVRHLDTGSKHDIPIVEGSCFWVAAFDHAQIAHTRHIIPIKITYVKE